MSAAVDVCPALIGQLKELHLPTVRACYEDTARRAPQSQPHWAPVITSTLYIGPI